MREVVLVAGTRPEAIKIAPLALELAASDWARPRVVVTGQHGEVVLNTLGQFGLTPSDSLGAGHEGGLPGLAGAVMRGLGEVLSRRPADLVVVQGDTVSAAAGAYAAFLQGVPVAHLEAGLRTGDLTSPFPEEGNRQLIARIAAVHLAPTHRSAAHLVAEGIRPGTVHVTGNTVVDAVRWIAGLRAPFPDGSAARVIAGGRRIVLVTAHRRESWGEPIRRVARAVDTLAARHGDTDFVVATHMNPAVREAVAAELSSRENIHLLGPLPYEVFVRLLSLSTLAITDSGGIQEEAPVFGVPVLVTRETTERMEAVEAGVAALVGTDQDRIVTEAGRLLSDEEAHAAMAQAASPFGDGTASTACAAAFHKFLAGRPAV
ncbi:non-hydrolyzing UDP-N-acetylglucosamine 2-epimerase [Streptoverticillium reticulum]|uniref:non-hydrolyzing UDP-N-acetylglucosamine 2-epimerase n=1 Tax=Streptoverticillium reticulum TaxID=1433415 RepID=UPI0039BFA0A8